MKTYVPEQGPVDSELSEEGRRIVEWLEREHQNIRDALTTALDLNSQSTRTKTSGQRLKDRDGMLRYVPDPTLDAEWADSNLQYYHDGSWRGFAGMQWKGAWVDSGGSGPDGQYLKNEVVTDDNWLAIANKTTGDKPAPYPIGEQVYVSEIPGSPVFTEDNVSSASLIIGTRYTLPQDLFIRSVRFYIPDDLIGFTAELWIVLNPSTDPNARIVVSSFTITLNDTESWVEIPIGTTPITEGTEFDIVAMFVPTVGETSFTYEWDYKRKNGNPSSGEAWHQSGGNSDQLRFHENDKDGTNRSTDLDNIGPGSTILMVSSGYQWTVSDASKSGSVYTFIVDPASRAGEDTSNFTFTYYAVLPIRYVVDIDHYSSLANVSGFLSTDGYDPDNSITLDDNCYGVDIKIQDAQISDDWDFMAYSG